jgi:hypothetical protein
MSQYFINCHKIMLICVSITHYKYKSLPQQNPQIHFIFIHINKFVLFCFSHFCLKAMSHMNDFIIDISLGKQSWILVVRVVRLWWFIICYVGRLDWSFCAKNIDLQVQRPTSRGMDYKISSLDVGSIDICNFII